MRLLARPLSDALPQCRSADFAPARGGKQPHKTTPAYALRLIVDALSLQKQKTTVNDYEHGKYSTSRVV